MMNGLVKYLTNHATQPNVKLQKQTLKISRSVFKKLGWLDSNQRDGGTKNRCLTTWRYPIIWAFIYKFYIMKI